MNTHVQVLIRLMMYIFTRIQLGQKLSCNEKNEILVGLSKLAVDFFSKYISDDELGAERVEVSPRNHLCLPSQTIFEDQNAVSPLLQEFKICTPVSNMSRRVRKKRQVAVPKKYAEHGYIVPVARRRAQSSEF